MIPNYIVRVENNLLFIFFVTKSVKDKNPNKNFSNSPEIVVEPILDC